MKLLRTGPTVAERVGVLAGSAASASHGWHGRLSTRTRLDDPGRRGRAIALAVAALCALMLPVMPAEARPSTTRFSAPVRLLTSCGTCPEPTITTDGHGRLYVMSYSAQDIAVVDNGQVAHRAGPTVPLPNLGDAIINADREGRLFVAGLVFPYGVQVWRSVDQGRTWATSVFAPVVGADRPWLAFGPNGLVYLTYNVDAAAEAVQTSTDNGATFGLPAFAAPADRTLGAAGPPIVDCTGRLHFAFATSDPQDGTPLLQLATSNDSGHTFSYSTIGPYPSTYFPVLSLDSRNMLHAAWSRPAPVAGEYEIVVASSAEGGATWGAPVSWSGSDTLTASPWIAPTGGDLDVLWYRVTAPGATSSLVFARGTSDGTRIERTVVADGIVARPSTPHPTNEANTDFAQFTLLPDGRAAVVWSDNGVWLAIEDAPRTPR